MEALEKMDSAVMGRGCLPGSSLVRCADMGSHPGSPGRVAEPLAAVALGLVAALLGCAALRCTGSPTGEQAAGPGSQGQGLHSAASSPALTACGFVCLDCW